MKPSIKPTSHPLFIALMAVIQAANGQQAPADLNGSISVSAPAFTQSLTDDDPPPIFERIILNNNGLATLSASYSHSRSNPVSMNSDYDAFADVFGGLRPQVQVAAVSSASSSSLDSILDAGASASGQLNYEVMVVQNTPPPITFYPDLTLVAEMRAEVSYQGAPDNNAQAYALVRVSNAATPRFASRMIQIQVNEEGADARSINWGFKARPGDPIRVNLKADVYTKMRAQNDNEPAILSSESMAIADPYFSFDQDQFNQDMMDAGLVPFVLSDHFSIIYSNNLITSIPDVIFSASFE